MRPATSLAALAVAIAATASFTAWSQRGAGEAAGEGVVAASAGYAHACALTAAGGVACWGRNDEGQLGNGTSGEDNRSSTPVEVCADAACAEPLRGVAGISAGQLHSCAVTTVGGVTCWGLNTSGQLGDGTISSTGGSATPVDVCADATCTAPLTGVAAVATGSEHSCALTTSGGVKCWGANGLGELGDGTGMSSSTPVDVFGLASGVAAVSAGLFHGCALTSAGGVKCWGHNSDGQLGDGTNTLRLAPVDVGGLASGVAAVSAGHVHSCAVTTAGGVTCWGGNGSGQLGDGTTTSSATPVSVSGLANGVAAVSAGLAHTCAVTRAGGVVCWGGNDRGQLGDGMGGAPGAHSTMPVEVCADGPCTSSLTDGTGVSTGGFHSCAAVADGVRCWGANDEGQLGDGQACGTTCTTPVDVLGLEPKAAPTPTPSATPTPSPCSLWGDVNGDGRVDAIDATYMLQYAARIITSLPCPGRADASGDGQVNAIDATVVLQCSAGFYSCASLPR